jgi:choice-of-anchor A domain-containing protein
MTKVAILVGLVWAAAPAQASILSTAFGAAADYNAFIFNNFSDSCCDVGGNLAVGGKTTANGFAVAQSQIVSAGQTGYYSYNGVGNVIGSVALDAGTGYLAGTGTLYLNNGATRNATCATGGFNCINFTSAATSLKSYSTFLAGLSNTTTATADAGGGYDITVSSTGTTVVTLTAAQLAAGALHLALPGTGTLLINVIADGAGNASTSNNGIFVNGSQILGDNAIQAERIVYNFTGTTFTANETITGTILAPYATVTGTGQQIDGQLIADNFTGSAEFHDLLFQGTLPPQTATPEPASFLMLGAGLLIVGTQSKRFRR